MRAVRARRGGRSGSRACARCDGTSPLQEAPDGKLDGCLACECPELYRHRDFNQKLGLLIIVGGAVACWFWPWWPLAVAAVVDFFLYFTLPDVAICYRCKAHHRGFPMVSIPAFDLERHEHYRFVKAREDGRLSRD